MVIDAFKAQVRATPDLVVVTFVDETAQDAATFTFASLGHATGDRGVAQLAGVVSGDG